MIQNNVAAGNPPEAGRFELKEQRFAGTPIPPAHLLAAAQWQMPRNLDTADAETELLHVVEVARHEEVEGHHWVGGKAMMTTIDKDGITQRVVRTWEEDHVGDVIAPLPIDFMKWRLGREREKSIREGLSKLQRERMEKKLRKEQRLAQAR